MDEAKMQERLQYERYLHEKHEQERAKLEKERLMHERDHRSKRCDANSQSKERRPSSSAALMHPTSGAGHATRYIVNRSRTGFVIKYPILQF